MNYDRYSHLLGVAYDEGDHDCYGLALRFYRDVYGLDIPDYARSMEFFQKKVNLIAAFLADSGFTVQDIPLDRLEPGDGLLLSVPASWMGGMPEVNHVGVYVGNGMFLHHLYQRPSAEDAFDIRWMRRVRAVVRHPEIARGNNEILMKGSIDFLSLLPEHVRQRHTPTAP
jgi:cell wall-associated NlpC family hydrolase